MCYEVLRVLCERGLRTVELLKLLNVPRTNGKQDFHTVQNFKAFFTRNEFQRFHTQHAVSVRVRTTCPSMGFFHTKTWHLDAASAGVKADARVKTLHVFGVKLPSGFVGRPATMTTTRGKFHHTNAFLA